MSDENGAGGLAGPVGAAGGGRTFYPPASAAGRALARARIPESAARSLAGRDPPAWVYLHGLKSPLSSTALRAKRRQT